MKKTSQVCVVGRILGHRSKLKINQKMARLFVLAALLFLAFSIKAEVRLPSIFGPHMVVQQNQPLEFWGWGAPNDKIEIHCSWLAGQIFTAKADPKTLRWSVSLSIGAASFEPQKITIKGGWSDIVLDDILFGEVWLCSGQSNMEWQPAWGGKLKITDEQNASANNAAGLRFFSAPRRSVVAPADEFPAEWRVSSAENLARFSATAFFFGRELREKLNVPIGLLNISWGGTAIENWMHEADFLAPPFQKTIDEKHPAYNYGRPGSLWNGMISPIKSLKIAGFIWYQGETNTHNPLEYDLLLQKLVADWRADFGQFLPFFWAQIAPWVYGGPMQGAAVRDEQRRALKLIPNSGMVVTSDIGDTLDIHPGNKLDVGKKFAALALSKVYKKENVAVSGPLFNDFAIEEGRIRVFFDHAENGLTSQNGPLTCFEIAGKDRKFYPAEAVIDGSAVVVKSAKVTAPVAVRFAFWNTATPNLFNKDGLPASCFRTDDWPLKF